MRGRDMVRVKVGVRIRIISSNFFLILTLTVHNRNAANSAKTRIPALILHVPQVSQLKADQLRCRGARRAPRHALDPRPHVVTHVLPRGVRCHLN